MKSDMTEKKFNPGFAFLRLWLAYAVVTVHFLRMKEAYPNGTPRPLAWFFQAGAFAVPVFMLMSFFLSGARFQAPDLKSVRTRLHRLLLPFVFWSTVTFALNWYLDGLGVGWNYGVRWSSLGWQLLGGTCFAIGPQMWFIADLLWLTVLFFAIGRFLSGGRGLAVLAGLFLGAAAFSYSGLNYLCFKDLPYECRYFFGRFFEMIPYAAVGCALSRCRGAFDSVRLGVRWLLVVSGLALFLFAIYNIVFTLPPGLGYQGLQRMLQALPLLAAAYFLPTNHVPRGLTVVIVYLSKFTMGVYLVHFALGRVLESFLLPRFGLAGGDLLECLVIFAASILICILISFIPSRQIRALVT